MFKKILRKIQNISFFEERVRFFGFCFGLLICLFFAAALFKQGFSSYYSQAKINADIDKAIYLIEATGMSFNIDLEQIVPSDEKYVYKFSVSNFNESEKSEIDIEYTVEMITTTNLPLNFELYKNEEYTDSTSTNLLDAFDLVQDSDGAWYKQFKLDEENILNFSTDTTDVYTLVIEFPSVYSNNLEYADCIENIEIKIDSKQIID